MGKLKRAVSLIRSGNKDAARSLLIEELKENPGNDNAWIWMTAVVDTDTLKRECLEEALRVNPKNSTAKKALATLDKKHSTTRSTVVRTEKAPASAPGVVRPRIAHFLALLLIVPGFWCEVVIAQEFLNARALTQPDRYVETTAYVLEHRIMEVTRRGNKWLEYDVRYQFTLPGDNQVYSLNDQLTGQSDLWATIDYDAWVRSTSTGRITVRYLPENPWANQPVEFASSPVTDTTAALASVTFCLSALLVSLFALPFLRHRANEMARTGQYGRTLFWNVERPSRLGR